MTSVGMVRGLTRSVGWLAVLVIIVLSLVPGDMRPHVMADDDCDHFAAYLIASSLLAIGYSRSDQLLSNALSLALLAGLLEIVQSLIPGRNPSAWDFAMSAFGSGAGVALVGVVRWARDSAAAARLPK